MSEYRRFDGQKLGTILADQGRRASWLAARLGISESLMSKVIAGTRTLDERRALRAAHLLGVDFFLTFELRDRSDEHSPREALTA